MSIRKLALDVVLLLSLCAAGALCGCTYAGGHTATTPEPLQAAAAAYLAGQTEQAVRDYTDFLGSGPPAAQAAEGYLGRGNAYFKLMRFNLAETDFRNAEKLARDRTVKGRATLGLAHALFAQDRFFEAEKLYMRLLRSYRGVVPQDEVTYRLGLTTARQGRWNDARGYLEDVLSRWPAGEFARLAAAKLDVVRDGRFTVQVGAFTNSELAHAKAADLRKSGFASRIVDIDIDGVPGFAVRCGAFSTWSEAGQEAARLERAGFATYRLP